MNSTLWNSFYGGGFSHRRTSYRSIRCVPLSTFKYFIRNQQLNMCFFALLHRSKLNRDSIACERRKKSRTISNISDAYRFCSINILIYIRPFCFSANRCQNCCSFRFSVWHWLHASAHRHHRMVASHVTVVTTGDDDGGGSGRQHWWHPPR